MPSDWLLRHIKLMESFHPAAYPDPGYGWSRPTIGWGRTEGAYQGETTTFAHEHRWLVDKLDYLSDAIVELLPHVHLASNQLDALTALVYNVGLGSPDLKNKPGFYRSNMRAKLLSRDFPGAATEFDDWVYSNGILMPGLVTRRHIERERFLTPSP